MCFCRNSSIITHTFHDHVQPDSLNTHQSTPNAHTHCAWPAAAAASPAQRRPIIEDRPAVQTCHPEDEAVDEIEPAVEEVSDSPAHDQGGSACWPWTTLGGDRVRTGLNVVDVVAPAARTFRGVPGVRRVLGGGSDDCKRPASTR